MLCRMNRNAFLFLIEKSEIRKSKSLLRSHRRRLLKQEGFLPRFAFLRTLFLNITLPTASHFPAMFEGLLADVLDSLAGSFIQGLDRQNLNVGIWSGDVVLSDLQVQWFRVWNTVLVSV